MQTTTLSFSNLHVHGELFANLFRARRESFIVQKNWDLPQADGMEFDQYDTPQSRWIAVHEAGEVLGGFVVACGGANGTGGDSRPGAVEVLEAQRQGKRPMPAAEVLRGLTLPTRLD